MQLWFGNFVKPVHFGLQQCRPCSLTLSSCDDSCRIGGQQDLLQRAAFPTKQDAASAHGCFLHFACFTLLPSGWFGR
jgi:hypothetical protein